jgi:aspartate aminotransferase-like enzyme
MLFGGVLSELRDVRRAQGKRYAGAVAVHAAGAMFVLDGIASGAIWFDMEAIDGNVLINARQKGWSASPCSALVMLTALARKRIESTTSASFACDLRKWLQISRRRRTADSR